MLYIGILLFILQTTGVNFIYLQLPILLSCI